jgi:hypothetical protein
MKYCESDQSNCTSTIIIMQTFYTMQNIQLFNIVFDVLHIAINIKTAFTYHSSTYMLKNLLQYDTRELVCQRTVFENG